jgi:hypothetical protein
MKKIHLLAALLIASSAVYGTANSNTNTSTNSGSMTNTSTQTQRGQSAGKGYLAMADDGSENSKYAQDSFATPTDKELNKKIRDKITGWFWDSYPDVSLDTSDGVVVLQGFVKKPKDQQDLMIEIRKIDGVKGVKSNLKVKENK